MHEASSSIEATIHSLNRYDKRSSCSSRNIRTSKFTYWNVEGAVPEEVATSVALHEQVEVPVTDEAIREVQ
jgi:hypothetical protein